MRKWISALLAIVLALGLVTGGWSLAETSQPVFVKVACGGRHAMALDANGHLYTWGDNTYGQLGVSGTGGATTQPRRVMGEYKAIAAGAYHSLAIRKDGTLCAWGRNNAGQVGDGSYVNRTTPVNLDSGFEAIAASASYSLAIKGGALFGWGDGSLGGLINQKSYKLPTQMDTGYSAVAAAPNHAMGLKSSALYGWGESPTGQLGGNISKLQKAPAFIGSGYGAVSIGDVYSMGLKGGSLYEWGHPVWGEGVHDAGNPWLPGPIWEAKLVGSGYTGIAAGAFHNLALKGADLYAWGENGKGQLGDGGKGCRMAPYKIGVGYSAIAAGEDYSLAIKGGAIYAWGVNSAGRLGTGDFRDCLMPTRITAVVDPIEPEPIQPTLTIASSTTLQKGAWVRLPYRYTPEGVTISYLSQNPAIASVDSTGKITGVAVGVTTVVVTATLGARSVSVNVVVTVTARPVKLKSAKILPSSVTLKRGKTKQLSVSVSPKNATIGAIVWKSSKPSVGTVDANGLFTALKKGTTTVSATLGGKTAKRKITVK